MMQVSTSRNATLALSSASVRLGAMLRRPCCRSAC